MRCPAICLVLLSTLPALARAAASPAPLLRAGTIITWAQSDPGAGRDDEALFRLLTEDADSVTWGVRWRRTDAGASNTGQDREFGIQRRVMRRDLESAQRINFVFATTDPAVFGGQTSEVFSARVLRDLRATGRSPITIALADESTGDLAGNLMRGMLGATRKYYRGELVREGSGPVNFPLLVDSTRVQVAALVVESRLGEGGALRHRIWILDDPQGALLLKIEGPARAGQIVRIDHVEARTPAGNAHGGSLEPLQGKSCRTTLSGVFFDTGSADLLGASAPAIDAAAQLLREQPGWTVTVEGHTDNVGSAASNQALSLRRAQAVMQALVARGVATAQLRSQGFGAARPVESNDTLEGRARNRRVDLSRRCP